MVAASLLNSIAGYVMFHIILIDQKNICVHCVFSMRMHVQQLVRVSQQATVLKPDRLGLLSTDNVQWNIALRWHVLLSVC